MIEQSTVEIPANRVKPQQSVDHRLFMRLIRSIIGRTEAWYDFPKPNPAMDHTEFILHRSTIHGIGRAVFDQPGTVLNAILRRNREDHWCADEFIQDHEQVTERDRLADFNEVIFCQIAPANLLPLPIEPHPIADQSFCATNLTVTQAVRGSTKSADA